MSVYEIRRSRSVAQLPNGRSTVPINRTRSVSEARSFQRFEVKDKYKPAWWWNKTDPYVRPWSVYDETWHDLYYYWPRSYYAHRYNRFTADTAPYTKYTWWHYPSGYRYKPQHKTDNEEYYQDYYYWRNRFLGRKFYQYYQKPWERGDHFYIYVPSFYKTRRHYSFYD